MMRKLLLLVVGCVLAFGLPAGAAWSEDGTSLAV